MAQPAPSDIATRWLSQSTLDELVRLAEKSPKEFQVHFRRLDIRRKLQLRRYLFQRHQDEGYTIPSMLMQPMAKREAAPTPEATSLDGMTIGDALDAAEAEETSSLADLAAPSQTSAAGGGAASLDDLFAAPAETSAAADEAGSLDDLFAAPAEEAPAAESDDGSMSLDDLFGDEAESEQAKAAEEEAEEEVVVDTAAPAGPTDYGVATPVEMPVDDIVAFLKPLPLFEGINDEGFSAIASLMRAERYAGDALLCRQGDQGNEMWVICEGAIRVCSQGQEIVALPAGQVVGEMAILDGSPRSTDLITGGETTLLTYTRDAYADTFRRAPDAGMALIKNISTVQQNRLRNTTKSAVENAVAAERAEGEIRRAKETQDLALPRDNNPEFGKTEFYVSFKGARGVSGDYYDFIQFPDNPNQMIVIMGDSTGHGLNAGLEMLLAKSASFTQIETEPSVEKITAAINNITSYIFSATMFMTFVCCLIDREKHTIRYTNAGQQSHPYLYRMKNGEFVALESQTFQLGIMQGAQYTSEEITYEDGDLLIFYSDGIIEAPYCPEGAEDVDRDQEFGDERLREFIEAHAHETPEQITHALLDAARAFCRFYDGFEEINGKEVDGDDITNIVIRLG